MRLSHLAPNQTIADHGTHKEFHSYETLIAIEKDGKTMIDPKWDHSNTTRKYFCQFIGASNKKEVLKRIAAGELEVKPLNQD